MTLRPAAPSAPSAPQIRLRVMVTGLRNNNGELAASLFDGEKGFPNDDALAVRHQIAEIKDHAALLTFEGLPPGQYGVALLHDENKNHKMDTNRFGFPREGYGISNNPRPSRHEPKFSDAQFALNESPPDQTITVRIVYLSLRDILN